MTSSIDRLNWESLPLHRYSPLLLGQAFQIRQEPLGQEDKQHRQTRQQRHFDPQRPESFDVKEQLAHRIHSRRERNHGGDGSDGRRKELTECLDHDQKLRIIRFGVKGLCRTIHGFSSAGNGFRLGCQALCLCFFKRIHYGL